MVYMYHSFLVHSSADGHLGCFHVLAMTKSAAMNIGVHVSLSDLVSLVCTLFWRDEEPWVSLLPKCKPGRGPSFRTDLWIQDFRTVRSICCLSHPVYGILLEQFKQTRTESAIQSNILHVNIRNFSFFQPLLGLADSEWCSREPHGLIPWSLFRMPRCAAISLWGKYLQRVLPVSILESSFSQI